LQGADLLIVPANWPSSTLDPQRLWSTHARINGMYVAVCNRTGKDRTLDCTHAVSCCFSPQGDTLFRGQNQDSTVFTVSIPLHNGTMKTPPCIPAYHDIKALDFKVHPAQSPSIEEKQTTKDKLAIHACAGRCKNIRSTWSEALPPVPANETRNSLLVCLGCPQEAEMPIGCKAAFKTSNMIRVKRLSETSCSIDALTKTPGTTIVQTHLSVPVTRRVLGINIGVVSYETARYPECLFRLAQAGCDVCVVLGEGNGHSDDILYNCVHRMVIVYGTNDKALIAIPPNGHEMWREEGSDGDGVCSTVVPFEAVRNKEWLRKVAHCMAECIKPNDTNVQSR
jgi:hypothetical protein